MSTEYALIARGPLHGGWATEQNQHFAVYAENPRWEDDAACMSVDPDLWFTEKGGATRQAKRICKTCEIRPVCLEYALEHKERYGVWGGKSERERRAILKRRAA